jgi:hypothetical protein
METTKTDDVTPKIPNARRRQQTLPAPGMSVMTDIPEVEEAAAAYRAVMLERIELQKQEKELKSKLREVALKHNVELFEYPDENGEVIEVKRKVSFTVRAQKPDGDEDDGE